MSFDRLAAFTKPFDLTERNRHNKEKRNELTRLLGLAIALTVDSVWTATTNLCCAIKADISCRSRQIKCIACGVTLIV